MPDGQPIEEFDYKAALEHAAQPPGPPKMSLEDSLQRTELDPFVTEVDPASVKQHLQNVSRAAEGMSDPKDDGTASGLAKEFKKSFDKKKIDITEQDV